MAENYKILLLDDEQDLLELYQDLLKRLPSRPDVRTCDTGARAIAMLDSEPFNLLISDLNMPRMDGLQVLSIVRRRFPQLRIVVMTSIMDEQYRNRAYSLGVDLFWQKPSNEQEITLFLECIESLLGQEELGGFRGIQSKSLVDIVQLECMSQNSTILKISNGPLVGRIWIHNGEIVDAAIGDMSGEVAFKKIITWKGGSFENMPPDATRTRTIFNSYQGLLLDAAQTIDENQGHYAAGLAGDSGPESQANATTLASVGGVSGVEFAISVPKDESKEGESWGSDTPKPITAWARKTVRGWQELSEDIVAGRLIEIEGRSLQRTTVINVGEEKHLCVGLQRTLSPEQVQETMKIILAKWVS